MDKILQMDYERALRSNHPKFIQTVIFRLISFYDPLLDPLVNRIEFLTNDWKRKTTAQEKIQRLLK